MRVLKAFKEIRVHKVPKDRRVFKVPKDRPVLRESPVQQVHKDRLDLLALQDHRVRLAPPDPKVRKAYKVFKVPLALAACKDLKALLVPQAQQAHLDHRESLALLVPRVFKEYKDLPGRREPLAQSGLQDQQELADFKD